MLAVPLYILNTQPISISVEGFRPKQGTVTIKKVLW